MRRFIFLIALFTLNACHIGPSEPPIAGKLTVKIHAVADTASISHNTFAWNRWPALSLDIKAPNSNVHRHLYCATGATNQVCDFTEQFDAHVDDPITFSVTDNLCVWPFTSLRPQNCEYYKNETTVQSDSTNDSQKNPPINVTVITTFTPS